MHIRLGDLESRCLVCKVYVRLNLLHFNDRETSSLCENLIFINDFPRGSFMRKQPCGVNFLPKLDNLLSFLQLLYSFLNANTILLSYCKLRCTKVSYRPLRLQYSNSDM